MSSKAKDGLSNGKDLRNAAIGIIGIIAIGAFAVFAFSYAIKILSSFLQFVLGWLQDINNTIDGVIIVALVTGFFSVITLFWSKKLEFKNKQREYLAQKREEAYAGFVAMVYKVMDNTRKPGSYGEEQIIKDMQKSSETITLWGSNSVAKKWIEFRTSGVKDVANGRNLFLLEEIMNLMRKDLGLRKTKKGGLLGFFVNDIDVLLRRSK